jgi:hypothetical protein
VRKKTTDRTEQDNKTKGENKTEKPSLIRAAYYIRDDQDTMLVKIILAVREQTGKRTDKSELVREAIDDLAKKYGVKKT